MRAHSVSELELCVCVCICVPCGFKGIHIWQGWPQAHPGLLLATSGMIWHCVCPDWLGNPWQPAQICDAVAGMESQHAAAKGRATGKQGTMPSRMPESVSVSNTSIPSQPLMSSPLFFWVLAWPRCCVDINQGEVTTEHPYTYRRTIFSLQLLCKVLNHKLPSGQQEKAVVVLR